MFCSILQNTFDIMKLRILYHGNCFDGVSSAAVFSKFYLSKINQNAEIFYTPTMHKAGNAFDREQFDGDENAIVDFKYCPDERLDWWFDHHQSAFFIAEDETHFRADKSGKKFLDTTSKSCAEFIARIAKEKFDFEDESLAELIHWAHIIDGALYESPAQCVELRSPALKLMQIIEGEKDDSICRKNHSQFDGKKPRRDCRKRGNSGETETDSGTITGKRSS